MLKGANRFLNFAKCLSIFQPSYSWFDLFRMLFCNAFICILLYVVLWICMSISSHIEMFVTQPFKIRQPTDFLFNQKFVFHFLNKGLHWAVELADLFNAIQGCIELHWVLWIRGSIILQCFLRCKKSQGLLQTVFHLKALQF